MKSYENIPPQLLLPSYTREDINILLGENGSGKSRLLNDISYFYLSQGMNVIAVANSIYDKFSSRHKNIRILRAATGKMLAQKTIFDTLSQLGANELKRVRNIANTLEYVGYDSILYFKIKGLNPYYDNQIRESEINPENKEKFLFFLNRFVEAELYDGELIRINFNTDNFDDLKNSFLLQIFNSMKELKAYGLIKGIEIFLSKSGNLIPLKSASSGELSLISTLLYVTATITDTTVILIDEPENSLHPKWQIEYIKKFDELFYLYQPKIVIATHSPLIINGAEINTERIKIFKGTYGNFIYEKKEKINVEEIYQSYFDLTAPQNRFLSEYLVERLNLLASKEIGIDVFREDILEIRDNSYDEDQKNTLSQILEMGNQILNDIS
jgi:predicted ATPase